MKNLLIIFIILLLENVSYSQEVIYTDEGYRIPTEFPKFNFPQDHGSHPEFRIEWWYITAT